MKERIISEIKRLAERDGGKPPGQKTFEAETGIMTSEWRGKIWIRWSEAVAEAGLTPNTLNAAIGKRKVLEDYAEATRHYGKPPTYAELRMYSRQHPEFMGVNTFRRYFENTDGVVEALREYAIEQDDVDLLALLPLANAEADMHPSEPDTAYREGWVYLLKSGSHYKVGRSDDLEKRVKQISVSLPEKVEMVHAIKTDDPAGIEGYWHRRFSEQRANGEWFKLRPSDIRAFKRRTFQ